MRAGLGLLVALTLTSCEAADPPAPDGAAIVDPAEPSTVVDGQGESAGAPAGVVNRRPSTITQRGDTDAMHGNVSPLNAAVSDLNVRMTDLAVIVELPADVLFAFNEATLTDTARDELVKAADYVRRGGAGEVVIIGHTDARGSDGYNLDLSRRRAEAVRDWFHAQPGVRERRYRTEGRGEREPVAANPLADGSDDPAGRARNRRVEVVVPR